MATSFWMQILIMLSLNGFADLMPQSCLVNGIFLIMEENNHEKKKELLHKIDNIANRIINKTEISELISAVLANAVYFVDLKIYDIINA